MKANELRIGNFVYPFDDIDLVSEKIIFRDFIIVSSNDFEDTYHLQPIPLTEEWLVKFGYNCANPRIFSNSDFDGFYLSDTNIEYVHQLQNLYFALTGEELTLKENS